MIHKSPLPSVSIPEQNLLDLLFPRSTQTLSSEPLWVDASDTSNYLSLHTAKQWIKRFGCGLQKRGIGKGDIVLLFTPNHVFVPVGYLGTIASGAGCSGANPSFTEYGKHESSFDYYSRREHVRCWSRVYIIIASCELGAYTTLIMLR